MLKHPNVVTFIGSKDAPRYKYIVLELADGGELFDRITPEMGVVNEDVAHFFYWQLITAMDYIHSKGVTHRDVKPENILLDTFGNIKITDFGLATVFRHKGKDRPLDKKCGTPPYVAPEVYSGPTYQGTLCDLWSCGIVLVAMLVGVLPWNEPTLNCRDYKAWVDQNYTGRPWVTLIMYSDVFALLQRVLNPVSKERALIHEIKSNPWFNRESDLMHRMINGLICEKIDELTVDKDKVDELLESQSSQMMPKRLKKEESFDTSQLSQQELPRVARKTAFTSRLNLEDTLNSITVALDRLGMQGQWKMIKSNNTIVVETRDIRNVHLELSARVFWKAPGKHLVDFRLSKGDGIEFKRIYKDICDFLFAKDTFGACTQAC